VFVEHVDTRLTLLKELIQVRRLSGGYVNSEEFMAFFPIHQRRDSQVVSALKSSLGETEFDALKKVQPPMVMVVEDEPNVRHGLVQILEDYGFEIFEAGDGDAALSVAESQSHMDLILMDVGLPGGRLGVDLIAPLKQLHPEAEVIMLTAYKSVDFIVKSFENRVFDYVTKPYDKNDLLVKISKALQRRCFKKIMPEIGKSLFKTVLNPKSKFKILNDIAKKRMAKHSTLLMQDVYLFFPELEPSQIPGDAKITAEIISDGLGLFVDTLISEIETGKACPNFIKKWKTYF
jgi:CheY-like chemotaxis protein